MRRLIALTATAAVALSLAPFTGAQAQSADPEDFVISISPAGPSSHAGNVQVNVSVVLNDTIDSLKQVDVYLADPGGAHYGTFCTQTYPAGDPLNGVEPTRSAELAFVWNTHKLPGATGSNSCNGGNPTLGTALSTNNKYHIKVVAQTHGVQPAPPSTSPPKSTDILKVNNTPSKPSGVKLGYNEGSDTITVEWASNPEPDVADYRIQECKVSRSSQPCEGNAWKTVQDGYPDTKVAFGGDGPGVYRYRVLALRPDADGATMVSDPASAQGDPTEIEIKEKPATTETSAPQVAGETTETTQPAPRTVVRERPTRRVQRAAPQVVQRIVEEEPGYNTELPYQDEEAISGLPIDDSGDGEGQRAILIPLAGGALLLVFAMQVHYLNRRANSTLQPVAVTGDGSTVEFDEGDDWDWDE